MYCYWRNTPTYLPINNFYIKKIKIKKKKNLFTIPNYRLKEQIILLTERLTWTDT